MSSDSLLFPSQMFHQIAEYAIDNPENTDGDNRTGLVLNPAVFHHNLYLPRPALEGRLLEALEHRRSQVCILGHAGSGKTSLVSHVLYRQKQSRPTLILRCDFRWIPDLVDAEDWQLTVDASRAMSEFLPRLLMTKLKTYILESNTSWDALIMEALRHPPVASEEDPLLLSAYRKLHALYQHDSLAGTAREPLNFDSWLQDRADALDTRVLSVFDTVRSGLTPLLLLPALTRLTRTATPAILVFDNIDSIPRRGQRRALFSFLHSAASALRRHARIILCARPENFNALDAEETDAYEVIDLDAAILPAPSQAGLPARQPERAANRSDQQARFECVVLERRMRYLEEQILNASLSEQERVAAATIKRRCRSLRNKVGFNETLARWTNFDVRAMLIAMAGFMDYLSASPDQQLDQIEQRLAKAKRHRNRLHHRFQMEWDYRMEGHFAAWMVGEQSEREMLLSEAHVYNLAAWLAAWWLQEKSALDCLAPHLLLATIYTSSSYTSSRPARSYMEAGEVLARCENIGIGVPLARGILLSMGKEEPSQRLVDIRAGGGADLVRERLQDTDSVGITERGRLFLEVISLQFHYLLALMHRQKIAGRADRGPSYSPLRGLKPWQTGDLLAFIADIGHMELDMLSDVQQGQGRRDWLTHFRQSFCLSAARDVADKEAQGDFLAPNMLTTCHAYLESLYQNEVFRGALTPQILQEYTRMRDRFETLSDSLGHDQTVAPVERILRAQINERAFRTPVRHGGFQARA